MLILKENLKWQMYLFVFRSNSTFIFEALLTLSVISFAYKFNCIVNVCKLNCAQMLFCNVYSMLRRKFWLQTLLKQMYILTKQRFVLCYT